MKYEAILRYMESEAWALHPDKMHEVVAVIEASSNGTLQLNREMWAELERRRTAHLGQRGRVHVMGLHGTISKRVGLLTGSGGTSTEEFGREFDAAMASEEVATIVVDIDSPGGSVTGVPELADKIYAARGTKRIVGMVNAAAYSAGYWLGSAFDEMIITPSGGVGSIGVYTAHIDQSAANEKIGLKVEYIHAGEYKVEGNPNEPLTDDARSEIQRHVDEVYAEFIDAVARNRGVTAKTVLDTYGKGRTVRAKEALRRGMVDRIATFEEVLREESQRIQRGQQSSLRNRMRRISAG